MSTCGLLHHRIHGGRRRDAPYRRGTNAGARNVAVILARAVVPLVGTPRRGVPFILYWMGKQRRARNHGGRRPSTGGQAATRPTV